MDEIGEIDRSLLYCAKISHVPFLFPTPRKKRYQPPNIGNMRTLLANTLPMFPIIGGWQLSFPDAQGVRTDYTLDNLGQTTSETIGGTLVGDVLTGGETTIYDYNAFGDLVDTTDPLSHKSTNIVDSVGRVYRTIQPNPDGSSTPLVEDHQPDPTTGSNYGWVNYTDGGYGNSYYKGDSASQPAEWTFSTTGKANRQFLVLAGKKGSELFNLDGERFSG